MNFVRNFNPNTKFYILVTIGYFKNWLPDQFYPIGMVKKDIQGAKMIHYFILEKVL